MLAILLTQIKACVFEQPPGEQFMRFLATSIIGSISMAFLEVPVFGQDMGSWFPMPSPSDVIAVQGNDTVGRCGSSIGKNAVADEVQRIRAHEGRCSEYDGTKLYNPYKSWIRGHDAREKIFSAHRSGKYETLGDFETVANYFYYHGLEWWDGRFTDGYQETAAKASQERLVQRTSRFAKFGYQKAPSERERLVQLYGMLLGEIEKPIGGKWTLQVA